ncbi:PLP-dependent aminotransferase family protein [Nakamurella silvestris]|nr:PLP-dependent aminotransferase family protein [Nakamurella silvestris]
MSTRVSAPTLVRHIRIDAGPTGGTGGDARSTASAAPSPSTRAEPSGQPAGYRLLAERIRASLLDGRLAVNTGLPSERELAAAAGLSRSTVAAAYALLREEGWISSRRGSGSQLHFPLGSVPTSGFGTWLKPQDLPADRIDLTTASLPAPLEPVTRAVAAATEELPGYLASDGYFPLGLPALRTVIAERYTAAGAPTDPEQILVTNGAQHAWSLVLAELSGPADRVLLECPTYPLALDAVRAQKRVPAPFGLRVDSDRPWDTELIRSAMRQAAPRLAYLIPDFQNPIGALMDTRTRTELIDAAASTSTTLVVDESLRDVAFPGTGPLPPSMAALDPRGAVISLGSVSKSLWGGLRVGWIRATPALVGRLAQSRSIGDMAGPVFDQLVVARLLADAEDALSIQRQRLATSCAALLGALAEHLPAWRPTRPAGGASLWVQLPGPYATELARLAPAAGVQIVPGPRFGPDGTMDGFLRLPFTLPPDSMVTAVRRLATVAERAQTARPATLDRWIT